MRLKASALMARKEVANRFAMPFAALTILIVSNVIVRGDRKREVGVVP